MPQVHFGDAPGMEEPKDRLGEGTAPFRLWWQEDLPSVWRQYSTDNHICVAVEIPDVPWGRAYYSWACRQLEAMAGSSGAVPVMLASMEDFRDHQDRDKRTAAARECLHALLQDGRPPQHFARILEFSEQ